MFTYSSDLSNGETLEADICIIGSGPAGLTVARELDGWHARVILIESGGLEFDEATQSLCDGPSGDPPDPYCLRHRQFCGTSNLWGANLGNDVRRVRYVVLDEIDFEPRDWMPYSGWPFRKSHLDPFYEKGQHFLGIGSFELSHWVDANTRPLDFQGGQVTTRVVQFGPSSIFLVESRAKLESSENIRVIFNSNAIEIEANEDISLATRIRCATLARSQFWVRAKLFVLATGGIENARLLLLSNRAMKTGLGNQHDLVGRFFMDHYGLLAGMLFPSDRAIFDRMALYDMHPVNGVPGMGILSLTEQTMHRQRLLNTQTYLVPRHRTYHWQRKAGYSRRYLKARMLNQQISRKPERPRGLFKNLTRCVLGYLGHAPNKILRKILVGKPFYHAWNTRGGWSLLPHKEREFGIIEVIQLFEQAPDPNNRVMLSEELDRLGCRKAKVKRQLMERDVESVRRTHGILREEFARSGLGRFVIDEDFVTSEFSSVDHGAAHHMGTTRMHDDPRQGVVDANCRVHGITNLYVAGSSVFPTGGHANPTFTIIALALRLSSYIKTLL